MTTEKTTQPITAMATPVTRPEFFRLPRTTENDPFFGFSRSYYYFGEREGFWRLVRLRTRGKTRGVTLVPYDQVAAFVRRSIRNGGSDES